MTIDGFEKLSPQELLGFKVAAQEIRRLQGESLGASKDKRMAIRIRILRLQELIQNVSFGGKYGYANVPE